MNRIKIVLALVTFLVVIIPAEAQFLKKLKNQVSNKVGNMVNGKESFGTATITNSSIGTTSIDQVDEAKITRNATSTQIDGAWRTNEADIFDGYVLVIGETKKNLKGTYTIGETHTFNIAYDPKMSITGIGKAVSKDYLNLNFSSGEVTINSADESSVNISFNGKAEIDGETVDFSGNLETSKVQLFNQQGGTLAESEDEDQQEVEYSTFSYPGANSGKDVKVRPQYTFSHKITHEVTTDQSKDKMKMAFLFSDENYYGINVNMSDYEEASQDGESFMVMENEETHIFVETSGMKMRMSQAFGGQMPMPDQEFDNPNGAEMKKTGATKKILGYTCYEYTVKDQDMEARFWVTPDLKVRNWMSFPENEISGHILEYDVKSKDGMMKSVAIEIDTGADITINSSEYRKGF
ncbi:MAG: DUF4412 domain-containing protein [Bacteroidota bacterium]